jgi:hypothetical protein
MRACARGWIGRKSTSSESSGLAVERTATSRRADSVLWFQDARVPTGSEWCGDSSQLQGGVWQGMRQRVRMDRLSDACGLRGRPARQENGLRRDGQGQISVRERLLKPMVSTTSVATSQRPMEYSSQVGCGSTLPSAVRETPGVR